MSLRRYFKPVTKLPSHSQTDLPANVLRDVNQAVTAVLQREAGSQQTRKKRKYTKSLTPEDCALIGKYANENGNAAAVKSSR